MEQAIRISNKTSRLHYEAIRTLSRLANFKEANNTIIVSILKRRAHSSNKLQATTIEVHDVIDSIEHAKFTENYSIPEPSAASLHGFHRGNFEVIPNHLPAPTIYAPNFRIEEVESPKKGKTPLPRRAKSTPTHNAAPPSPTPARSYSTPRTLRDNKNITAASTNPGSEDSPAGDASRNTSNNNNAINNTPITSPSSISARSGPASTTSKRSKRARSNEHTAATHPRKAPHR